MRLTQWLKMMGDREAADLLDLPLSTIKSWRQGRRLPRPDTARRIEQKTRKRVTIGECYK